MKLTLTQVDHVLDRVAQRQIGGVNQPVHMFLGGHVVIVVMIMTDFKETIALQTIRHMHLEAKTYIFHTINF